MSAHNGPRLNLMRDRLEQGKCCACGKNNPLKGTQILCPECMGKSNKGTLHDNFHSHKQRIRKGVKNKNEQIKT